MRLELNEIRENLWTNLSVNQPTNAEGLVQYYK